MPKVPLSLNEIIETLRRSNLPTVVTEGSDDYLFYRRVEDELKAYGVSLFPAGGRDMVLQLFENRKLIGRNDVMFLIDADLWVYSGVPSAYIHRKIICTDGYSIENDLYRDGDLEDFLLDAEKVRFQAELSTVVDWYSFAVEKCCRSDPISMSEHPNRVIGPGGGVEESFAAACGYTCRSATYHPIIMSDYRKFLRGKTLLELLVRHLSPSNRAVKFGKKQLMEIACVRKGAFYKRITNEVEAFFRSQISVISTQSQ